MNIHLFKKLTSFEKNHFFIGIILIYNTVQNDLNKKIKLKPFQIFIENINP